MGLFFLHNRTRKAAARATTNRRGPTYARLLKEMVEEDFEGRWPKDLNCDQEFRFKQDDASAGGKGSEGPPEARTSTSCSSSRTT